MRNQAQFEAMGLAVVVVLISLGMFLLLFFSLRNPTDFVQRYNNEQIGKNTVDAFLKTNVETCSVSQTTFTDLIQDMAESRVPSCGPGSNSANLLDKGALKILNMTLDQRGIRYQFTINDADTVYYQTGLCDPSTEQHDSPGQQILRFFPSLKEVNVTLYICFK